MTQPTYEEYLAISASHVVRLYLWDMLSTRLGHIWDVDDHHDVKPLDIPIIPAQDQPDTQTSERPYIVYDYSYTTSGDPYQIENESLTLRVFSQSTSTLAMTTKLCIRLFGQFDKSAADINRWINDTTPGKGLQKYMAEDGRYNTWIEEVRNFKFLSVSVPGTQGAEPAAQEAGRLDTLIFLDIKYVEREWIEP